MGATPGATTSTLIDPLTTLPSAHSVDTDMIPTSSEESGAVSLKAANARPAGRSARSGTASRKTRSPAKKSISPKPPDPLFTLPEVKPDIGITIDGAYYVVPADVMAACLRFTAEQMVAVQAMRDAGVSEDLVLSAFPPKAQVAVLPSPAGEAVVAPASGVVPAAPAAPAVVSNHGGPRCRGQELDPVTKNVLCTGCGEVMIRNTGRMPMADGVENLRVADFRSPRVEAEWQR